MSENDHDWAARRHQQDASNLWGSEGGSIAHWNANFDAQRSQQMADAQRAAERRVEPSGSGWSPPLFVPVPGVASPGHHTASRHSGPIDESRIGFILWQLVKWTVLPLLLLAGLAVACWWGAREADRAWIRRDPEGGVTRYATSQVFPGETLSRASAYLGAKDEANALQGAALVAALRAVKRPLNVADPRHARLLGSAYRCQVAAPCRAALLQAAPEMEVSMLDLAVSFLANKAKGGSEAAARDGCLLPLLTSSAPQAVFLGRNGCATVVAANRASMEARSHLARMDESGWFRFARVLAADGL